MESKSSPILFFSPYSMWNYQSLLEITWAHALKQRGEDVRFLLCDGMSNACDVYREVLNPRTFSSCMVCQALTARQFASFLMPYEWTSRYLPPGIRVGVEEWVAAIPNDALLGACWKDMPVGEWASSSIYWQFRMGQLPTDDQKIERIVRDFLIGTVLFAEACDVALNEIAPHTLVLLNGRFFANWTIIELAKRKGIRFVTHERGFRRHTVRFVEGGRTHELTLNRELWGQWGDVPLTGIEIKYITEVLEDRRQGRNYSRLSFSPAVQEQEQVRQILDLDSRRLVAVFNSSDDETVAFPERRLGAFPDSYEFLPAVIDLAQSMPDTQFVIRIHPNIQKDTTGTNKDAVRHALEIKARAPENVRVILPLDDISSYTLADIADVGLVYSSTIGLEMAMTGKPVLCMVQSTYSHTNCVTLVNTPEELAPKLEEAIKRSTSAADAIETARIALRWGYRYFSEFSIPFNLVQEGEEGKVSMTYNHPDALIEGAYANLDRICRFLKDGEPIRPIVTDAERKRTTADEDQFLRKWISGSNGA